MAADNASRCASIVGCLHSSRTWWMSAVGAGQKGQLGDLSWFDARVVTGIGPTRVGPQPGPPFAPWVGSPYNPGRPAAIDLPGLRDKLVVQACTTCRTSLAVEPAF